MTDDELLAKIAEDNRKDAERPRYKALIELAGTQDKGVMIELVNGKVLRGSVYPSDASADWVRVFTWDVARDSGPVWVNQDHIVCMWWAPDVLPFDMGKAMDEEEDH